MVIFRKVLQLLYRAFKLQLALNHLESYQLIFYRIFNVFLPEVLGHSTANILIWSGIYHLIIYIKDSDF